MNNKNTSLRKSVLLCLSVVISACDHFDPANSPGIKARWTADSLALNDGDAVSLWPDSALNGYDALATASSRPTYKVVDGVPLVRFDGIDDYLTAGSPADWRFLKDGREWTVFVVYRSVPGESSGRQVLLDSDGEDAGFSVSYDDRPGARWKQAVRVSVGGARGAFEVDMTTGNRSFHPGKWGIISARFKPSTEPPTDESPWGDRPWGEAELFVNGYRRAATEVALQSDQSRGATELIIGRQGLRNALLTKGDVREIVIYDRALSNQEHYEAIQNLAVKVSPAVRTRTALSQKWLGFNPDGYQAFGIAFRIPTTGKLVTIQRHGVAHVGGRDGEVRQWESTDRGATWKSRLTYDSEYDDRGVGGGLASKSGSIVIFFSRYDGAHWVDMRALRSLDDAGTFDDIGTPLPTHGCTRFLPYGPMIELPSGRLLQTFYGSAGRIHKVWISESDDDGLTWTFKSEIYSGVLEVNETSLAWVSGGDDGSSTLIAVSRHDGGSGLLQFVSRDGGNTWASQGPIPGGAVSDLSPWLHRLSDGNLVLAWHERSWFTFRIRVALAEDVAASPANWGPMRVTYNAVTRTVGDSGYPALVSATGWDDDLIQVIYDGVPVGKANLLISPVLLP